MEIQERRRKPYLIALVIVIVGAVLLSTLWRIPYVDTLIGFAGLAFVIDLMTLDEDLPGGLRNPNGQRSLPWRALAVKGAALLALVVCAICIPQARLLGT